MTYPTKLLVFVAILAVGCSAGRTQPGTESSDDAPSAANREAPSEPNLEPNRESSEAAQNAGESDSPTPELDERVRKFLALPGLDSRYYPDFKTARSKKMDQAKEVNDAVKEAIAESKDGDVRAHLAIQRARIFFAVACQMANIKAAPDADEAKIDEVRAYGTQAADLFFAGADESLRDAVGFGGARSAEAAEMLGELRGMTDRRGHCADNERLWRPEG